MAMVILENSLGVVLVGVIVASILYGFTCIQTWRYFTYYPLDPWHVKLLVLAVFVTDTCHEALLTYSIYTTLIIDYGVFSKLFDLGWCFSGLIFFNTFTTLFVQSFMAWRIYRLSNGGVLIAGSVMAFILSGFTMYMFLVSKTMQFETYLQLVGEKNLSMAVNATAAVGDIYIAGILCYLLQRSRTGFRKSDTMITKLIVFTINTGLLTSVCALFTVIALVAWPATFTYIACYDCIGRLYCNTLLATLNARREMKTGCGYNDPSVSLLGSESQGVSRTYPMTVFSRKTSERTIDQTISTEVDTTHELVRDEHPETLEFLAL